MVLCKSVLTPKSFQPSMKGKRCVLSVDQAREIYKLKFLASTSASAPDAKGQFEDVSNCILLARMYGVSSKTIRDIWNRKTWANATEHLLGQGKVSPIISSLDCPDFQV